MESETNKVSEEMLDAIANDKFYYIGIKASPFATETIAMGLSDSEVLAMSKRFKTHKGTITNGVIIEGPPFEIINALAELGYRVISTTGEAEILWTLQRVI